MTLPLVQRQTPPCNRLISRIPCGPAHCVPCVANTRWLVYSFIESIFSVNIVCFALDSPGIGGSGTCCRTASAVPDFERVFCPRTLAAGVAAGDVDRSCGGSRRFIWVCMTTIAFAVICPISMPLQTPNALRELHRRVSQIPSSVPQNQGNYKESTEAVTSSQTWKRYGGAIICHREQLVQ